MSDLSVYKPLISLEQDGQMMCNEDEIMNILDTHYASVSAWNSYTEDFLRQKDKPEQDALDFENAANKSYNQLFPIRELNGTITAAGNTASGPDNILYSILNHL